jgi:hypothetical protein
MPRYFRHFPVTKHTNQNLVDITKRARFKLTVAEDPTLYMPYTITDEQSAEELSFLYYGTVDHVWMIYLANEMLDPYKDWPMRDSDMYDYIADKYTDEYIESTGDTSPTRNKVLNWTQDATITDNILYYEAEDDDEVIQLSQDSWAKASIFDPAFIGQYAWVPVRIFEAEINENDNKRTIFVINKDYASRVAKEFKSLMNG